MLQLIDKGYYDYDFEKVVRPGDVRTWEQTVRSDEETQEMLAGFGIGTKKKKKPETVEEIQDYIIKQEKYGS